MNRLKLNQKEVTMKTNSPSEINPKFISDYRVSITPPSSTLKITGTRLVGALGMSRYTTPFQIWAEICKVYKPPFEDNKYTLAGKAIEPKQAEYVRSKFNLGNELVSPSDEFGENYFFKTFGDFYKDEKIFGGMWDYLYKKDGKLTSVLEMKTAQEKKKPLWDASVYSTPVPFEYLLQGCLYAYLSKVDSIVFVATFLNPSDYDAPEKFVVNDENTKLVSIRPSKHLPRFEEDYIKPALEWWDRHVVSGVSPSYDINNKDDMAIVEQLKFIQKVANYGEQTKLM